MIPFRTNLRIALVGSVAMLGAATREARADVAEECAAGAESAQPLRASGKLLAARKKLLACAREECPVHVRRDCQTWLDQVNQALPTIIPLAKDEHGNDSADARVSIDGLQVASELDGKPISLDPGQHLVRFERANVPAVEVPVVVAEGVKDRTVMARFTAPADATPPLTYVLTGVSLFALASGITLDVVASSRYAHFNKTCAPSCGSDGVTDAHTMAIVGDVSLGTALASGAVALWLFLSRPKANGSLPSSAAWMLAPTRDGVVFGWHTAY